MSHEAIADFEPEGQQEIRLQVGDKFRKVKDVGNGWAIGTNSRTNETGVFPASYVQKVEGFTTNIIRRLTKSRSRRNQEPIDTEKSQVDRPTLEPDAAVMKMHDMKTHMETDTEEDDSDSPDDFDTENDMISDDENDRSMHGEEKPDEAREKRLNQIKNFADQLFSSERNQFAWQKSVFGIIMGVVSGVGLFFLLGYGYSIRLDIAGYITLGCTLLFCLGLALSVHCRCIGLLMLPSLATARGRALLLTIIVSILLSGPIQNISNNAKEVSAAMACSMSVIYNQSDSLKTQLQEPINQAADQIEENTKGLRDIGNAIETAFGPISSAINAIDSGAQDAKAALNAASVECKRLFSGAYTSCVTEINNAKTKCVSTLGSLGLNRKRRDTVKQLKEFMLEHKHITLALLMKGEHKRFKRGLTDVCNILDVSGICQVVNIGSVACAPVEALDSAANGIAKEVQKGVNEIESWFAFDVIKELGLSGLANATKTPREFIDEVDASLNYNIDWVQFGVTLLTNLLALTLVLLLIQSFVYLKSYISQDEYNNVYITTAFKAYDKERETNGESFILPLKKREKRGYTDTKSLKLSPTEVRNSTAGMIQIILHMIFAFLIVFFDYILYYCVYLINRYGRVNIELSGQSSILLEITGTGQVAKLMRSLITGINLNNVYDADFNVTSCLPNPTEPNFNLFYAYAVVYTLAIVAVLSQSYSLRLKRKICAYYYPEQEVERTVYLHRKIRHDRKTHQLQLKQHLRSMKKEKRMSKKYDSKIPFADRFRKKKLELRTCLNCGSNEGKNLKMVTCSNATCSADYCETCMVEMGEKCHLCGGGVN
ncbi:DC-STAMP domain-containing protein 2-like [Mizuhopecten yessoensis]|uniref:DC-STAMP domain-containing protein 2 n=1 Tax=Mizuhopecten yessoensis TaxID=6573 RepID=A0A210R3Z8_MIZYE|nr:DC-STAMP domain-containing protein 2-like [Mizuhopecten yessoensis]OWF55803.1 DC-STAMP domain-containing protein 2 [Mizuhopecten yessoensis]